MPKLQPRFDWLSDPRLGKILDALGAEGSAKFVGGCVRDSLLGQSPLESDAIDIDIATDRTPDEMRALFGAAGIKAIATGESHGTMTAVVDGLVAECTTLRRDVDTDGRHADVQFTRDWEQDWRRRDFTINALYTDRSGEIWDPAGGLGDLEGGVVEFIGEPSERIKEDALRILRFFRFSARFADTFDAAGLASIKQHTDLLDKLSRERVWSELSRTFSASRSPEAMEEAAKAGVLQKLLPGEPRLEVFKRFRLTEITDLAANLVALWPGLSKSVLRDRLRPSNDVIDTYQSIEAAQEALRSGMSVHELLYRFQERVPYLASQVALACGEDVHTELITELRTSKSPQLPIRGQDIVDRGINPGPEISKALAAFERLWLDAGVPDDLPTVERLLAEALGG